MKFLVSHWPAKSKVTGQMAYKIQHKMTHLHEIKYSKTFQSFIACIIGKTCFFLKNRVLCIKLRNPKSWPVLAEYMYSD